MTALTTQTTVGELVADNPSRSRIFERLGIDYCCGGQKTLEAACKERGLDARTLVELLEANEAVTDAPTDTTNWKEAPLPALIDHIVETHHAYLRRELPRLNALLSRVASRHGAQHEWLLAMQPVFRELSESLEEHMRSEEERVFPAIRKLSEQPGTPLGEAVEQMEEEHEEAGVALKTLRELSGGFTPPAGACNSFRALLHGLSEFEADMHQHVHLENNVLFPRALAHGSRTC